MQETPWRMLTINKCDSRHSLTYVQKTYLSIGQSQNWAGINIINIKMLKFITFGAFSINIQHSYLHLYLSINSISLIYMRERRGIERERNIAVNVWATAATCAIMVRDWSDNPMGGWMGRLMGDRFNGGGHCQIQTLFLDLIPWHAGFMPAI